MCSKSSAFFKTKQNTTPNPRLMKKHQAFLSSSLLITLCTIATAEISMPAFFSDGMVLQQEIGSKIWGTANPNQEVTVSFSGKTATTKSDNNGKWSITLKELKASQKGEPLTITAGNEKKEINDVLVGEVWLASGQSNMEWQVSISSSRKSIQKDNDNLLRVYVSPNRTAASPATNFPGTWKSTQPENTASFTAVGYEFAKVLREKLNVPVGIIECSWGGKPVQSFTSQEALEKCPEANAMLAQKKSAIEKYDPQKAKEQHQKALAKWKKMDAEWQKNKKGRRPRQPKKLQHPALNPNMSSSIYNGMIAPLIGYGARGVIWYQGESNAKDDQAKNYGELLECLIQDWRKRWDSPLSFYYVQLASFTRNGKNIPNWVDVQDEMRRLLDDSNSKTGHIGMATTNDIGHPTDIHPKNKKDVGKRLARWALNQDYNMKDIIVSGPLYKSHTIQEGTIEITFDHAKGLKSRNGKPINSFEIADADGKWQPAEAKITGDKIKVSSKSLSNPTQARYAWHSNPTNANLVNGEGLPTSCFTTK